MTAAFLVVPRRVPHGLRRGEEQLLADPERLIELAARYGTEVLGDYPV